MIKKILLVSCFMISMLTHSQTISIVGTGVNGWPPTQGPEITLSTNDNVTYTINNLAVSTGFVKFRQDLGWSVNWGGSTFPNGNGVQNGPDIPTVAGTYDVTFNRVNGTYTFIGSSAFPTIGIWGPAVDSQNGFGGNDVDMVTSDGVIYTLSGFNFSSGNAYFRQDNNSNLVWGAVAFPSGVAVQSGPTIPVTGGEWFVTFNRNTGAFSFEYPKIGILGTALNGFGVEDTDLNTTDGFNYTISSLVLSDGEVKFRKDNSWNVNWGSSDFPSGTGTQNGPNIPVTAGTYSVSFERTSGTYSFINSLSVSNNLLENLAVFPNPVQNLLTIESTTPIDYLSLYDASGKMLLSEKSTNRTSTIDTSKLQQGVYFLKVDSGLNFIVQKIVKK